MAKNKKLTSLEEARRVLHQEAAAIETLAGRIGPEFERAVDLLHACESRVVLTGIGKAGIIARKIAATFASTGTPSFFMHSADAVHGDLGMVTPDNVVVILSHSGKSDEVLRILPYFQHFKIPLIAITADDKGPLAQQATVTLLTHVEEEACPLNLAPTTSTTVMLALGDALAVALLNRRDFKAEQFAIFHPSGTLGKRLLIKVGDLMHTGGENPVVAETSTLREAILEMTGKGLGATSVIDAEGRMSGILTDGDMRRILQGGIALDKPVSEVLAGMKKRVDSPKTTTPDTLAVKAFDVLEEHRLTVLPVLDESGRPCGMVHLHDIIRAGITS